MTLLLELASTAALAAAASAAGSCKVLADTDFNGHDMSPACGIRNSSGPSACCDSCAANPGCYFWTFAPPDTCCLKSSDAGRRPSPRSGAEAYTSGCRNQSCAVPPAAPPPPPLPPAPAPPPLRPWQPPNGGGACTTDWNCSLGGECTAGKCVCDPWFTGHNCTLLNLQRAKPDAGFRPPNYHSWGGHAAWDERRGLWMGLFSFMVRRCSLDAWTTNSASVLATSKEVDGPYTLEGDPDPDALAPGNPALIVPPWSHNTYLTHDPPSGEWQLWHIGSGQVPPSQWRNCNGTAAHTVHELGERLLAPSDSGRMAQRLSNNKPVSGDTFYIATAKNLSGPWNTSVTISAAVNQPANAPPNYWGACAGLHPWRDGTIATKVGAIQQWCCRQHYCGLFNNSVDLEFPDNLAFCRHHDSCLFGVLRSNPQVEPSTFHFHQRERNGVLLITKLSCGLARGKGTHLHWCGDGSVVAWVSQYFRCACMYVWCLLVRPSDCPSVRSHQRSSL